MKKKTKIILVTLICSAIFSIAAVFGIVKWMFGAQYNKNGISHFLVVTIDNTTPKTYLGDLEGHKVYIEGLNIKETNFRTIKAENMPIKQAIEEELVSIKEWKENAFSVVKQGGYEILKYDNYEIFINKEECIIRPLSEAILNYDCNGNEGFVVLNPGNSFSCNILSTNYNFVISSVKKDKLIIATEYYGLTKVKEDGSINLNSRDRRFEIKKGQKTELTTQTMDYNESIIFEWK